MYQLTHLSSAKDLASNQVFEYDIQPWESVFDITSWAEEQEFSRLHHILLDIHPGDLRQELEYSSIAINVPDIKGQTPLLWAAMRGDNYAVTLLLEFGADPNIANALGILPIFYCYNLSVECLKELLVHGSMIEYPSKLDVSSALHYATGYSDDIQILEILLDAGADPMARNLVHWTPCHSAVWNNNLGALKFLIDRGADLDTSNVEVASLLLHAVLYNSHACLVYLLEAGSDVKIKTTPGATILHVAAEEADESTLQILASFELSGVDPDATFEDFTAEEWLYGCRPWNGKDPPSASLENAFLDLLFKVREDIKRATGNEGDEGDEGDENNEGNEGDENNKSNEGGNGADQDKIGVRVPGSWI
ncbi:MAG: hypothetical protein Q9187_000738 [Circinaria calcarea]